MKRILSILFVSLFVLNANAQFLQDQAGTAYLVKPYSDITGSPFYSKDWTVGMVKLGNGATYNKVDLKYNIFEEILLFKGKNNNPLEFVQPIDEFVISDASGTKVLFKNISIYKKAKDGSSYFQVLYGGGVPLYKKLSKEILESKEYGSSTVSKKFEDVKAYFSFYNNELIQIKKIDEKQLNKLFPGKEVKLKEYLKSKTISFKNENDLTTLFEYLNSN